MAAATAPGSRRSAHWILAASGVAFSGPIGEFNSSPEGAYGFFAAPGITKEQQEFYAGVFKKVSETPEWKKYTSDMGLKDAYLAGPEYVKWLEEKDKTTQDLMRKGGLIK